MGVFPVVFAVKTRGPVGPDNRTTLKGVVRVVRVRTGRTCPDMSGVVRAVRPNPNPLGVVAHEDDLGINETVAGTGERLPLRLGCSAPSLVHPVTPPLDRDTLHAARHAVEPGQALFGDEFTEDRTGGSLIVGKVTLPHRRFGRTDHARRDRLAATVDAQVDDFEGEPELVAVL
jgi:hypothetical protein